MAEAREVMDRVTDALVAGRLDELRACYADDATVVTPETDEIRGADAVVDYLRSFADAFPDRSWEEIGKHEAGDTAIDEGYFCGTNTGPLQMPSGETVPPTGKRVRLRECDVVTVSNGRITSHRFYYDQTEFAEQLGLAG
jgi:ketosteroid isomerase-like protein